jgi:hypothetical protein
MVIGTARACMPFSEIVVLISPGRQVIQVYLMFVLRVIFIMHLAMGMGIQPGQHAAPGRSAHGRYTVGVGELSAFGRKLLKTGTFWSLASLPVMAVKSLMVV